MVTTAKVRKARTASAPKRHADHITTATDITPRVKLTYSDKLREHAVWVDGVMVATAHAVSIAWSVCLGDSDGPSEARKFAGIVQTEKQAADMLTRIGLRAL